MEWTHLINSYHYIEFMSVKNSYRYNYINVLHKDRLEKELSMEKPEYVYSFKNSLEVNINHTYFIVYCTNAQNKGFYNVIFSSNSKKECNKELLKKISDKGSLSANLIKIQNKLING